MADFDKPVLNAKIQVPFVRGPMGPQGDTGNTTQATWENLLWDAGDISNQYKDLSQLIDPGSLLITYARLTLIQDDDYVLSTVAGKTRITLMNAFASGGESPLEENKTLHCHYRY